MVSLKMGHKINIDCHKFLPCLFRFEKISATNSNIRLHTMPNVGHWLHVEDLDGMLNVIMRESGLEN